MIIIKCLNIDSLDILNYYCFINNKKYKSNNGIIKFSACLNKIYKIIIFNQVKVVYYTGKIITVTFVFKTKKEKRKRFKLTDRFYSGLKIEKGELFLWPII